MSLPLTPLPESIRDVEQLEDLLSAPTRGAIETASRLKGDVLVLGAGGKMGPTLSRMLRRAIEAAGTSARVIGVSRFSEQGLEQRLRGWGIDTVRCDLLDPDALEALPDAPNVIYMPGMKFGSSGQQALTWAINAFMPGIVCRRFRHSKIVAFSTGNVYALTSVSSGGSRETDEVGPIGEYAMSCLGRERIFQHFSRALNVPVAIVRLNYAVEMRYGVIADMASRVFSGQPIDLTMGHLNAIWQADANAAAIRCFGHAASPPFVVNVTGQEILSVRRISEDLGRLLDKEPRFTGVEAGAALLSNAGLSRRLFGEPGMSMEQVIRWTADWVSRGGASLNKPTHFETRDGKF